MATLTPCAAGDDIAQREEFIFKGRAYTAEGWGGHFVLVAPYLDLVVVHRVDTDVRGRHVTRSQFGRLIQLILDAKK